METMTTHKAWDRLPQETNKSYAAFQVYISLPVFGEKDETRSLRVTQKKLGLASDTILGEWSAKYNWVERAQAYDAYMGTNAIVARETAMVDYQQAVITSLSTQLVGLNRIIENKIRKLIDEADPAAIEVKRLAEAVLIKDNLARRLGAMPTNFLSERVDDEQPEEAVFVIGGK